MTNEEIRIKVAEAMGWQCEKVQNEDGHGVRFGHTMRWRCPGDTRIAHFLPTEPPNYPESLDACAKFEATLTDEEHLRYRVQLWNVVITEGDELTWDRQFISATARQRCLAYLKTKGIIP